jgi:hypothetical protein
LAVVGSKSTAVASLISFVGEADAKTPFASSSLQTSATNGISASINSVAGDTILCAIWYSVTGSVSSVTDLSSNAYTQVASSHLLATNSGQGEFWIAKSLPGSFASNKMTVNWSVSQSAGGLFCMEFAGPNASTPVDNSGIQASGLASVFTSNSFTPTVGDAIIAAFFVGGNTGTVTTPPAGFTTKINSGFLYVGYLLGSTNISQTISLGYSGGVTWGGLTAVTLKH